MKYLLRARTQTRKNNSKVSTGTVVQGFGGTCGWGPSRLTVVTVKPHTRILRTAIQKGPNQVLAVAASSHTMFHLLRAWCFSGAWGFGVTFRMLHYRKIPTTCWSLRAGSLRLGHAEAPSIAPRSEVVGFGSEGFRVQGEGPKP